MGGDDDLIGMAVVRRALPRTGELSEIGDLHEKDGPGSFLALGFDGRFLYSVAAEGAAAFSVDADGKLSPLNTVKCDVPGGAHVAVAYSGSSGMVVSAAYHGGGINIMKIKADGSLSEASSIMHKGDSQAHPHSCFIDASGKYGLIPDLGLDKIYVYRLDVIGGQLVEEQVLQTAEKAGPRHMCFHPKGQFVYGINELDCTINVYAFGKDDTILGPILQTDSDNVVVFRRDRRSGKLEDSGHRAKMKTARCIIWGNPRRKLTKPTWHTVASLTPEQKGINLYVKVVPWLRMPVAPLQLQSEKASDPPEVVLGDATGVVTLRPRDEQLKLCAEGAILRIQNAQIRMVANHMRLEVSKWGVLKAAEHEDIEPCTSNDVSAAKWRGACLPTKVAGRVDEMLLFSRGLSDTDAGLLQGGCLPNSEGILQDVSMLGDPGFHPYSSQTGEPKWQARGGLLRLSLEEIGHRFGEEIAQDVVRCAKELDKYDASRRVGVELPWHPMEDRELEPAEAASQHLQTGGITGRRGRPLEVRESKKAIPPHLAPSEKTEAMQATLREMQLSRARAGSLLGWIRWATQKMGWRLWVLVVAWIAHYLHGVRRVRLHLAKTRATDSVRERMQRIVARCPSLHMMYWPTWYAHTALQQIILLGLKEIRCALQWSTYKRQIMTLRDTSRISRSSTMKDLAKELAARGILTLVMNRRGYGDLMMDASTARVTLFGFDEDLDEVLLEVGRKAPGRPVAVVGFSCGSGFAGRYGALRSHLSAWTDDNGLSKTIPRLLCVVGYDPGFHVVNAMKKVPLPYRWGLDLALRYQYVYRHRETWKQKSPSSAEVMKMVLDPAQSFDNVYRNVTKLSGFGCSNTWLEKQQPSLKDMQLPCLLINSRDDPICVWENVEEHASNIEQNPYLALAELQRGSHGCKLLAQKP
eukprot:s257_g37.t1